ncbi:hypothetical protein C2G38_2185719 [Gigaspora rosea]|uniref:Uncharacterized protein n=1 Tax=Gigaspora rosea TaxID=44941 RepID=A0A397V641_9GLOM|nr:hypothetical protein C2G38_2185719 [Gigaspora rosea]
MIRSLYCGAVNCGINIGKQNIYQGTKYGKYLGDETPYHCENCNEIYQSSEEYTGRRENIKEFLQSDSDITNSETLKNLTDEAIKEDTMDGITTY